MPMSSFLERDAVLPDLRATSKKQLLQELSAKAASIWGLDERSVFDALQERERLGATSVGDGVAIPHARLREVESVQGLFARLHKPVDFDAADEAPVDLVFMLLAPEAANAEHLKALAKISRLMKKSEFRANLRGADGAEALYSMLTAPQARAA